MSYPKQDKVADRLQSDSLDALTDIKDAARLKIERAWRRTRTDLRGFILDTYHSYFHDQKWNLAGFKSSGAQAVMHQGIRDRIDAFKHQSWIIAKNGVNDLYRESIFRHAWVLDQTTPPNIKINIPYKLKLLESASYYAGDEATKMFQQRWSTWNDSYVTALATNLQLGALNESEPEAAADEVDATTINTPRSTLIGALVRTFEFNSDLSINEGIRTVSQMNESADVVEIWETRRNLSVCDVCADNEGLTSEEVEDWIPAHPNCRCYWRIVPAEWAKLLRSGDENQYATAIQMDSAGLVPNAMVLKDERGRLAGNVVVDFNRWKNDNIYTVAGQ